MAAIGPRAVLAAFIALVAVSITVVAPVGVVHAQRLAANATAIPSGKPESVGMSTARLARITSAFNQEIADNKLPGAVMMVARRGRLVYAAALGRRDPNTVDPMRTNALFRIYSMTKPMVSVSDPGRGWSPVADRSGLEMAAGLQGREGVDRQRRSPS